MILIPVVIRKSAERCREMRKVAKVVGLCMTTIFTSAACAPASGPESIAQSFVERYYVKPDLPKAKALAYGLARQKIEEEEQLLQAVTGPTGAGDRGVSYSLHATRKIGDDRIFFVYNITISVDRQVMKKRATIAAGRTEGGWRVTNFQEVDI